MAPSPAPVYVDLEWTPNPNTIKLVANRPLMERGIASFKTLADAAPSTLAQKLLGVPGITGVMFGANFVTLTRGEQGDWVEIHEKSVAILKAHLDAGLPAMEQPLPEKPLSASEAADEKRIREVLDNEIRPAVAMDGGDVQFDHYSDGVLYVHMRGACSGCPSATYTLKMGIEKRLQEAIPGLKEVVQV